MDMKVPRFKCFRRKLTATCVPCPLHWSRGSLSGTGVLVPVTSTESTHSTYCPGRVLTIIGIPHKIKSSNDFMSWSKTVTEGRMSIINTCVVLANHVEEELREGLYTGINTGPQTCELSLSNGEICRSLTCQS